jgi:hypothetical protein
VPVGQHPATGAGVAIEMIETQYMKTLWTAWADYGATGEGRTLLVWIGYAENAAEARDGFGVRFGDFFKRLCEAEEGCVDNEVTRRLVPGETIERLRELSGKAHVEFYTQLHVNAG